MKDDLNETQLAATRTFTWSPLFVEHSSSCDGYNYEQRMPLPNVRLPRIKGISAVMDGDAILVTVEFEVDELWKTLYAEKADYAGKPFVYGCANSGTVTCIAEDCSQFKITGVESGESVNVTAQVGDTLGYVAISTVTIDPNKTLTVQKSGDGGGTVLVGKLECDSSCSELLIPSTSKTAWVLKAIPDPGSRFVRWEDATGKAINVRVLRKKPSFTVIAVFDKE